MQALALRTGGLLHSTLPSKPAASCFASDSPRFRSGHNARLDRGNEPIASLTAPILNSGQAIRLAGHNGATRETSIVIGEASNWICGKRLWPLMPITTEPMKRHGHLHSRWKSVQAHRG
jgi:hypothetical protein